jgi:hypothetical protein
MTLADLIPAAQPQGAGIFARHEGRLVFVGYRPRREQGGIICGRVGGWRKTGESWLDCVRRETREEICCDVNIISSDQCYFAEPAADANPIDLQDDLRPFLVSLQHLTGRGSGLYYNVIFLASLLGEPRLGPQIELLVFLTDANLLSLAQQPLPLSSVIQAEAKIESRSELPPESPVTLGRSLILLASLINSGLPL